MRSFTSDPNGGKCFTNRKLVFLLVNGYYDFSDWYHVKNDLASVDLKVGQSFPLSLVRGSLLICVSVLIPFGI
jgi:hypothetical protein